MAKSWIKYYKFNGGADLIDKVLWVRMATILPDRRVRLDASNPDAGRPIFCAAIESRAISGIIEEVNRGLNSGEIRPEFISRTWPDLGYYTMYGGPHCTWPHVILTDGERWVPTTMADDIRLASWVTMDPDTLFKYVIINNRSCLKYNRLDRRLLREKIFDMTRSDDISL